MILIFHYFESPWFWVPMILNPQNFVWFEHLGDSKSCSNHTKFWGFKIMGNHSHGESKWWGFIVCYLVLFWGFKIKGILNMIFSWRKVYCSVMCTICRGFKIWGFIISGIQSLGILSHGDSKSGYSKSGDSKSWGF